MINKSPPLCREYSGDPNIEALKRRAFINHGSTLFVLEYRVWDVGFGPQGYAFAFLVQGLGKGG